MPILHLPEGTVVTLGEGDVGMAIYPPGNGRAGSLGAVVHMAQMKVGRLGETFYPQPDDLVPQVTPIVFAVPQTRDVEAFRFVLRQLEVAFGLPDSQRLASEERAIHDDALAERGGEAALFRRTLTWLASGAAKDLDEARGVARNVLRMQGYPENEEQLQLAEIL